LYLNSRFQTQLIMASYSLNVPVENLTLLTKDNFSSLTPLDSPIDIEQLLLMVKDFQDSKMNTHIKEQDSSFQEAFDITKESLQRVLDQPSCEGIRIFFSLLPDKQELTLSFVGINAKKEDLIYVDDNAKIQGIAEDQVGKPDENSILTSLAKLFRKSEFDFLWT
jgi:hypothetical protein